MAEGEMRGAGSPEPQMQPGESVAGIKNKQGFEMPGAVSGTTSKKGFDVPDDAVSGKALKNKKETEEPVPPAAENKSEEAPTSKVEKAKPEEGAQNDAVSGYVDTHYTQPWAHRGRATTEVNGQPSEAMENQFQLVAAHLRELNQVEEMRLMEKYGTGWSGKFNRWMNETDRGKVFKIGAKVLGGSAAAIGAGMLSGVGIAAASALLAPLMYTMGPKYAIDGALEALQYYLPNSWGGERSARLQLLQCKTSAAERASAEIARIRNGEIPMEQRGAAIQNLLQQVQEDEARILQQQADYQSMQGRHEMQRGLASSLLSLTGVGAYGALHGLSINASALGTDGPIGKIFFTGHGVEWFNGANHGAALAVNSSRDYLQWIGLGGAMMGLAGRTIYEVKSWLGGRVIQPQDFESAVQVGEGQVSPVGPNGPAVGGYLNIPLFDPSGRATSGPGNIPPAGGASGPNTPPPPPPAGAEDAHNTPPPPEPSPEASKKEAEPLSEEELRQLVAKYFAYLDDPSLQGATAEETKKNQDAKLDSYLKDKNFREAFERYGLAMRDEILPKLKAEGLENLTDDLHHRMEDVMAKLGLKPSVWGDSRSWVYWDIAKQIHYLKPGEQADPVNYPVEDPFESEQKRWEIVDRHVGWEARL